MSDETDQPRLLYVSPMTPAVTGSRLAMRARATLTALAHTYRVTLLIAPRAGDRDFPLAEVITSCSERVVRPAYGEALSPRERFDVVHIYRFAALPEAAPWMRWATERQIDLDSLESVVGRRLAALARMNGNEAAARRAEHLAEQARAREADALSRFDRVIVSSEANRRALLASHAAGAGVVVLPNSLPRPETTPFPPPSRGPFTLLFVGALGDEANEDAMRFFSASILPRIQAGADRLVTLRIVGMGAGPAIQRLDGQAGVEVVGEVDDVAPWYRDAHLAIVPTRAGGGSNIKVLEAFVHRRPVVATTIGLEGIAAEHGRHAFIADDPGRFATLCLRLLHDPALAARMADDAFALFQRAYTDATLARTVAALATRRG